MKTDKIQWVLGCGMMLALGCGAERDDAGSSLELAERGGKWGCKTCGFTNSPTLGTHALGTFHVGRHTGSELALVGLRDEYGALHPVELVEHALTSSAGGLPVSGDELIGWALVFEAEGARTTDVEILNAEVVGDWVTGAPIVTYALAYGAGDARRNVCEGRTPEETSVTILSGERYDEASKTVIPQPGIATLACKGHALAKMKFMGHAPDDGYGSSPHDRQATLKMLTADYCGTGQSFTQLGQPLAWVDGLGLFAPEDVPAAARLEARWNARGATCLDTPRAVPRGEVEAQCSIPRCASATPEGADVRWLTLNPSRPPQRR